MTSSRVLALVLLQSVGASAAPSAHQYKIDVAASRMVIHVGKTGLFRFAGHEHEIVAPVRSGTATVDADHIERSSVEMTFSAAQLRVTGRGEPPKDVPKVQQAMVGPECLDAPRFPEIRFVSTLVGGKAVANGFDLMVRGTLTLHGFSHAVTLPVHLTVDTDSVVATGTMTLRQTDFGMRPISVAGVVKVQDAVTLEWRVVARSPPVAASRWWRK
jgi:polyisoprenoid-binding protein YceI